MEEISQMRISFVLTTFFTYAILILVVKMLGLFAVGRLYDYSGRINRKQFILKSIYTGVIIMPIAFIIMQFVSVYDPMFYILTGIVFSPFNLYLIILQIKRLHDINYAGNIIVALAIIANLLNFFETNITMILGTVVSFALLCLMLIMLFMKGTNGANKYGEDPLAKIDK